MKNRYDIIPSQLLDSAINLMTLGIHELAWERKRIDEILKILSEYKKTVLGGDVYKIVDGTIVQTLDSWYVKSGTNYLDSYTFTHNFIQDYETKNRGEFVFSLIF